jgi:hypothetical protein
MNALPESLLEVLTASVDGYTLTLDACEGVLEVTSPSGLRVRAPFYARWSLRALDAPVATIQSLEGALHARVLRAVAIVKPLAEAPDATDATRRARSNLGALSAAARLFHLRTTRRAA